MSQPRKPRYRTSNWKQYNASLKARGSLTVWLDKGMCWFATASGKRGRSRKFSDAAIQFCLTLKNLFGLALRQTTGFAESVLHLCGLAWPVPDFSTLCRRQLDLNVQVPYTRSQAGLHLLVDSTGIKFLGEGEWKCKKHGPERRRQWRKLHIGIDAQTLQVRAICVTSNNVLRESQNPQQVAELAQHTVQTLIRVYADPHPQIAMVEITRFHQQTDPSLSPPAPGRCVSATPEPVGTMPKNGPRPDCINAAGCLFCTQHRDIESEDHVWSLGSLRHLKSLELARYRPSSSGKHLTTEHPALLVIDRLTAKLRFFEESSEVRRLWVEEARARISEGDYHPAWDGFIRLAELRQRSA